MTRDHHIRFSVSDLLAVVLTCQACRTSLSYPMDAFGTTTTVMPTLPHECPQCGDDWNLDAEHNAIRRLLFALSQYREFMDRAIPPVSLQFDLPGEDD